MIEQLRLESERQEASRREEAAKRRMMMPTRLVGWLA